MRDFFGLCSRSLCTTEPSPIALELLQAWYCRKSSRSEAGEARRKRVRASSSSAFSRSARWLSAKQLLLFLARSSVDDLAKSTLPRRRAREASKAAQREAAQRESFPPSSPPPRLRLLRSRSGTCQIRLHKLCTGRSGPLPPALAMPSFPSSPSSTASRRSGLVHRIVRARCKRVSDLPNAHDDEEGKRTHESMPPIIISASESRGREGGRARQDRLTRAGGRNRDALTSQSSGVSCMPLVRMKSSSSCS